MSNDEMGGCGCQEQITISQVIPPPPAVCNGFYYTVRSGDSLWSIGQRFGVSLAAMILANPQITNPAVIFPGQVVCVPVGGPPTPPPPPPPTCTNFFYTVRAGDTLASISTRFGVRTSDILAANPQITDPNVLITGQVICIPLPPPPATCTGFFYTIRTGDSLATIASRFGVTVSAILAANPQIINQNIIYAGQVICIPGVTPTPPPPPPPTCTNFFYTVRAGDTLASISTRFGVRTSDILAANPQITDPNVLITGQVICIPLPPPPATCTGFFYTIRAGDSLATIASRFGVTVSAILAANPQIINQNIIYAGQVICIPGVPPTPPPPPPTCTNFYYTVRAGDTLASISTRFGVRTSDILAANPQIIDPNVLITGQVICIPLPPPPAVCAGFFYTIRSGDTLAGIASRFGLTVGAILAANPQIINSNIIYVGQVICIPVGATLPPPPPTCAGFFYTVQPNETLSQIAARFGVSVSAILAANPQITDPNVIFTGQVICIPFPPPPPTCSGFYYTVQRGDTLSGLASRYGVTTQAILNANPQIINPDVLLVGQVICIPLAAALGEEGTIPAIEPPEDIVEVEPEEETAE